MRDWIVTYYNIYNQIISAHVIKNRTEHQAEHEAYADMPCHCEDWSMVPA
jgi:hypothetical protein